MFMGGEGREGVKEEGRKDSEREGRQDWKRGQQETLKRGTSSIGGFQAHARWPWPPLGDPHAPDKVISVLVIPHGMCFMLAAVFSFLTSVHCLSPSLGYPQETRRREAVFADLVRQHSL